MKTTSNITVIILSTLLAITSSACSGLAGPELGSQTAAPAVNEFVSSGSIVLSKAIPVKTNIILSSTAATVEEVEGPMSPLIGFFPPTAAYVPALNETWIEISKDSKSLKLFVGHELVEEMTTEGELPEISGSFILSKKVENPIWRASDSYFNNRGLMVPRNDEKARLRKGALGRIALVLSNGTRLHSAPLWTKEVGGIRISNPLLAIVYDALPVGAPVLVK